MSHLVTIQTQIREPTAVSAACRRLELPPPETGEFKLFARSVSGLAIRLRDWIYPFVCQPITGDLHYDNFDGQWGEPARLDEFLQAYAVEHATTLARRQGYSVREQSLPSGAIQLTLKQGGAT